MPRIRAWFFDAVGTLIHPEPPAATVYAEVGRRHGSLLDAAVIAARFREAFCIEEEADRQAEWRTSERREVERWRRIVAGVLDDVRDRERCFEELWDHFARPEVWRCNPDAAAVLAGGDGMVLGVASNFDSRLRTVLAGMPELRPLRHVIVSSEVGWRKPAGRFFEEVVRASGSRPQEVLLVGDDPENDYEGALAVGLAAVLYDPADRYRGVCANRLRGLRELID